MGVYGLTLWQDAGKDSLILAGYETARNALNVPLVFYGFSQVSLCRVIIE